MWEYCHTFCDKNINEACGRRIDITSKQKKSHACMIQNVPDNLSKVAKSDTNTKHINS